MRAAILVTILIITVAPANAGPALLALHERCTAGNKAACDEMDKMLATPEIKKWVASLETKCEKKKDDKACAQFGLLLSQGIAVPHDVARATKLLTSGCQRNNEVACYGLGALQQQVDPKLALETYTRACTLRSWIACYQTGVLHQVGVGTAKDEAKSAPFHRRACDEGKHTSACYELGRFYYRGTGVAQNPREAAHLFTLGCNVGHAWSCQDLGYLYESGSGVDAKDDARAVALYEKACKLSDPACINLAIRYGRGPKRDLAKALPLYERACNGGEHKACVNLGLLLREQGDEARAMQFFAKACKGGVTSACKP
ncbi:MAG: sel1 repeat family protein [Myxococcota bacterium]|nr:sel1 repeat family protein [Myxococcota bacterium]